MFGMVHRSPNDQRERLAEISRLLADGDDKAAAPQCSRVLLATELEVHSHVGEHEPGGELLPRSPRRLLLSIAAGPLAAPTTSHR